MGTVRGWLIPALPAPVVQSRSDVGDAANHASRSANLREHGISDCSSSSDETEDHSQSPTPPKCPKLECDLNRRFQSVSCTESKADVYHCISLGANPSEAFMSGPLHLSIESAGPERQVDRFGDAGSYIAVPELPGLIPDGSSDNKSSPISLYA